MKKIFVYLILAFTSSATFAQENLDEEYQDVFVVVVDTSDDYYSLRTKMFQISQALHMEMDTLGRGFDKKKNLICLPEDNEDEIYAGDYFPRRYPTDNLSLEYLSFYTGDYDTKENVIALVASISENREAALNVLNQIKSVTNTAYIIDASVYMGCIH